MFCNDPVASREHMWPQWMRRNTGLDCSGVNHSQTEQAIVMGGDPRRMIVEPPTSRRHSGATVSRRLPVVCKDRCNSGWMSRLEDQVMPILSPMIDGAPRDLGTDEQLILSRWADKTVMVIETTSPSSRISSQADRKRVMDESNPSPARHTRVWIGHNTARPNNAELRGHKTFSRGLTAAVDGAVGIRSDVITVGQVLFYVVSTTVDEWAGLVPSAVARMRGRLIKIWPSGPTVHWPPLDPFSNDQQVAQLVNSLTEDGAEALSKVSIPATEVEIARVWP